MTATNIVDHRFIPATGTSVRDDLSRQARSRRPRSEEAQQSLGIGLSRLVPLIFSAGACDGPDLTDDHGTRPTAATWYEYACEDHHPREWCERWLAQASALRWSSFPECRNLGQEMLLADEQDRILRWAGEYYAGEYVGGYDCFTVGSYGQDEFPEYYCRDVAWGMTDDEMRRKIAHERGSHSGRGESRCFT